MSPQFFSDLSAAFKFAKLSQDCRAVVLQSSNPRFFTAGLDLKAVDPSAMFDTSDRDPARKALKFVRNGMVESWQNAISAIETCRKPVVCLINGMAIGGAIDVITACDIRFCSSDALFSVREVNLGLAADLGTLQRLPKICGNQSWVRDICFTGRDFKAEEALNEQLVSKVFGSYEELLRGGYEMALLIASKSPVAVQGTKELLLHARDHSVEEGIKFNLLWSSIMLQSEDVGEAVLAVVGKKLPTFSKL